MPPRLRDIPFKYSYGASDDRLHEFYIPALGASKQYDRSAGFFSSYTLAIAAAGISRLIANGGTMRLLVGAQLSPEDVDAIRKGYTLKEKLDEVTERNFTEPTEKALKQRLEALAWMVAEGALEIKVVLPLDKDGLPLPERQGEPYYHPKTGIFTDADGDQIAFSGSSNESVSGWIKNYEVFHVFRSWDGTSIYIKEESARFDRLWKGTEPDWVAMPIPEAARKKLLRFKPSSAPTRDPLERTADEEAEALADAEARRARERLILQFLKDAPYLAGASGLGAATCAIQPWPHQVYIARQAIAKFPHRYLIADEVGLGKTISTGLVIRQLYLSGRARRILILTPKSVLRQWQEELYEKFALNVPRYDGATFLDVHNEAIPPNPHNPWNDVEIALASSQLVKRRDRQGTLLAAERWDLVVVDEAHHARRKDFLDRTQYRPNRLLELLIGLQERTDGLLLLTATPMQVDPIEIWDLVNLLGLAGTWGTDGWAFLRFFTEIRQGVWSANWDYVMEMIRAEVKLTGLDERFQQSAREKLGPVEWSRVEGLVYDKQPGRTIQHLSPQAQTVALELSRHHTPLRRLVFRNTRGLLRRYLERGLLDATVPTRDVTPVWIPLRPADERPLYDRLEEYITEFYQTYESERKGLGFVMTIYRRRLTSSFYAVRKSLERRLDFLRGLQAAEQTGLLPVFDDDDLEQEALSFDFDDELEALDPSVFQAEIAYVEDFLHELGALSQHDSKAEQLLQDLQHLFLKRDTAIVFTQYTDTMDFLRERLRLMYGTQVACYSGRGGERYDGIMWVPVTKEEIKNAFREGEEVKILLCTEAASEGLNLQTCGVLINYDMPWNPMRAEQRIGRIDRIGQRYEEVAIHNYFYENTVESNVYHALEDRIDWFQDVVGRLQPILGQVSRTIQTVAMKPAEERQQALQEELERIREALEEAKSGLDLDQWANEAEGGTHLPTPVRLQDLEKQLLSLPVTSRLFRPHESIERAYWLQLASDDVAVTFDPACYDEHPSTLTFLTYGHPLLDRLFEHVLDDGTDDEAFRDGVAIRIATETPTPSVGWYYRGQDGAVCRIERLDELLDVVCRDEPSEGWSEAQRREAQQDLDRHVDQESNQFEEQAAQLREARRAAWESKARALLLRATLVNLARHQKEGLFSDAGQGLLFNTEAVRHLRHQKYPFAPLLKLVSVDGLSPQPTDPYFLSLQAVPLTRLDRIFQQLKKQAQELLEEHVAVIDS